MNTCTFRDLQKYGNCTIIYECVCGGGVCSPAKTSCLVAAGPVLCTDDPGVVSPIAAHTHTVDEIMGGLLIR